MGARTGLAQRSTGMDVFFIEAVVAEVKPLVTGAVVKKIHQPDADTVIFRLWNGYREVRLRMNLSVNATGLYLTERPWINPVKPMRFCQLLRARLVSLRSILQLPDERIVILTFEGGDAATCMLVAELYGRRPNLILCDAEWRIIDVLHRREGDADHQTYLRGEIWSPPEKKGGCSLAHAAQCWSSESPGECPADWLRANVHPMSPLVARQLACRMEHGEAPEEVLGDFAQCWQRRDYAFHIVELEGSPRLFAFLPEGLMPDAIRIFESASAAADAMFSEYLHSERGAERTRLMQVARRALARVERRLERLQEDRGATEEAEALQRLGELLTANLHRVRKGMIEIEVENYYAQGSLVKIPLDPALSPAGNADRLFAKSKKIRRGYAHIARRLEESGAEKQWLEALLLDLGEADTGEDLAGVAEEMRAHGLLPNNNRKSARRAKPERAGIREALSPGGYVLQWGANNRANDYLVKHLCRSWDLWFHALGRPGCHLVLKKSAPADIIPEADILYAASLAVGFSSAKAEGRAEVMVAEGRHVHKLKGALPGLVQVKSYRTVRVAPRRSP